MARYPCPCGIDSWSEVELAQHAGHAEMMARRQTALETFHDVAADDGSELDWGDKSEAAIETATRVRITPEIVEAYIRARGTVPASGRKAGLTAAFRAAGFEVEQ